MIANDDAPSLDEVGQRLNNLEIAMEAQGSINQRLIAIIVELKTMLENGEGNGQKPSALILPPRLQ